MRNDCRRTLEDYGKSFCNVAAAVVGSVAGPIIGSALSSNAASNAADTQAQAAANAQAQQQHMFDVTNAQQAPWRNAGGIAVGQLGAGTQPGGEFSHEFNANDLNANLAPNYEFQLLNGLGAINNGNTVSSGLVGGNALKAANDYAQGFAGNAYQNAFNNYNTNKTNIFNRLASIAQLGQTSANTTANSALGFGTNIGNAIIGQGTAQASGIVGSANALSSGINNAYGMYRLNNMLGPSSIDASGFGTGGGGGFNSSPYGTSMVGSDLLNV